MHYTVFMIPVPTYVSALLCHPQGLPSKVHSPNASGSLSQYVTLVKLPSLHFTDVVTGSSSFMLLKLNHFRLWLSQRRTLKVLQFIKTVFLHLATYTSYAINIDHVLMLRILVMRSILIMSCKINMYKL